MKTMVKIMVVLAVLFAGTAGTVSASQDSLPGSPLYALKTSMEDWRLNRANTPEKTIEVAMDISDNRVDEAVALANKGEIVPAQVAQSYGEKVNTAFQAMGELDEPAQNQLREKIAKELGEQVQVMEQAQVNNNGEDCQLQNMFQVMEQAGNMAQEGNAYQYAGEDTPGVTTKCQGDECEQVGPNADNGNGPGEPGEPGNDACEPNGPNNDGEPGNEDPGQIQDGNNGGQNQGDIGNVHGNGNDNDNSGGNDSQGGQNGGDNGSGDGNGNNGGSGGNGGGN